MNYIFNEEKPPLDELVHYGVKGMRWGVRRSREELDRAAGRNRKQSNKQKKKISPESKKRMKSAAKVAGALVLTAGSVYAAHAISQNGKKSTSEISKNLLDQGFSAASEVLEQPTDIIWATRGKNIGFDFRKDGNISDPLSVYEDVLGTTGETTNRYFKKLESGGAAAIFPDPEGRRDFSGRLIPHEVVIPPPMATNINSLEDVEKHIWPKLQEAYDVFYEESKKTGY